MTHKIISSFLFIISGSLFYLFIINDLEHNEQAFKGIVSGLFAIAGAINLIAERLKNNGEKEK